MNATLSRAVMGIGENVSPPTGWRNKWITSLFARTDAERESECVYESVIEGSVVFYKHSPKSGSTNISQ